MPEFEPWPKIPRLASPFIITEKIDGTNSAVLIVPLTEVDHWEIADGAIQLFNPEAGIAVGMVDQGGEWFVVFAQSRKRFITPISDNFGFAAWVRDNAEALVSILGPGRHFGEWWGNGIQRGYGLPKGERRFSLFNVTRYNPLASIGDLYDRSWPADDPSMEPLWPQLPGLGLVPVIDFEETDINLRYVADRVDYGLKSLELYGSRAVAGGFKAEGVVLFHERSRQTFKAFVDDSEKAAEVALRRSDVELAA